MSKEKERPPVHESIEVLDHVLIDKNPKWWSEATLQKAYAGRNKIAVYLWTHRGDRWVRKGKFTVQDKAHWDSIKKAVEKLLPKL